MFYCFTADTPRVIGNWGLGADLTIAAGSTGQTWSSSHWREISDNLGFDPIDTEVEREDN